MTSIKTYLNDQGIKIPVSIADVIDTFLQYPEMIKAVRKAYYIIKLIFKLK